MSGLPSRFVRWLHARSRKGGPARGSIVYGSPYGKTPPGAYGKGPYGQATSGPPIGGGAPERQPVVGGDIDAWGGILNNYLSVNTGPDGALISSTLASLPAAGTAGRLRRVTDDIRGLHLDNGIAWEHLTARKKDLRRDFQVRGDGTDETTNIQAALDAAITNGWHLIVPPGQYGHIGLTIGSTSNHWAIEGVGGPQAAVFFNRNAAAGVGLTISRASNANKPQGIVRNITFDSQTAAGPAIQLVRIMNMTFDHVFANGGNGQVSWDIQGGGQNRCLHCRGDFGNYTPNYTPPIARGLPSRSLHIRTAGALNTDVASEWTFIDFRSEGSTSDGILIEGNAARVSGEILFIGGRIQGWPSGMIGILIDRGSVHFLGTQFETTTGAPTAIRVTRAAGSVGASSYVYGYGLSITGEPGAHVIARNVDYISLDHSSLDGYDFDATVTRGLVTFSQVRIASGVTALTNSSTHPFEMGNYDVQNAKPLGGRGWLLAEGQSVLGRNNANSANVELIRKEIGSSDYMGIPTRMFFGAQVGLKRTTPTYGVSVAINASLGNEFDISVTDGVAFTIATPTSGTDGQRITITVRNVVGGPMGAVTWGSAYLLATWTNPANANSRSIDFKYNGTNWIEISRTPADVPN